MNFRPVSTDGRPPQISVLMPVYNGARFLKSAIASVVRQDFPDWELIIVNDGSTDESEIIMQAEARADARIRIWKNDRNLGLGTSRRLAVSLARAQLCAVLDGDDEAMPGWLEHRLAKLAVSDSILAISGSREIIDVNGRCTKRCAEELTAEEASWGLRYGNPMVHSSAVFRTKAALAAGSYPEIPYLEDWALFRNLARAGEVVQLREIHVRYRVHAANSSSSFLGKSEALRGAVRRVIGDGELAPCPAALTDEVKWLLFRGRHPFVARPCAVEAALGLIHEAFAAATIGRKAIGLRLAALYIQDMRNVMKCGGWSLKRVMRAVRPVLSGRRQLSDTKKTGLLRELGALVLMPCTSAYARSRGVTAV